VAVLKCDVAMCPGGVCRQEGSVKVAQSLEDGSMFAWFWPLDFSFSGFFVVGCFMLWMICQGVSQAAKGAGEILKNEDVQEAGKNIFRIWLEKYLGK